MDAEVERLRKKVENYPSPSSYNRLAELLKANAQIEDAEHICKRSMRDFPRNSQAYVILAEIERDRGNAEEARGLLTKAIENDKRGYGAFLLLAELYEAEGHVDLARQQLEAIFGFKPDDPEAKARLERLSQAAAPVTAAPAPAPAATPPAPAPETDGEYEPNDHESALIDLTGMSTGLTSILTAKKTKVSTKGGGRTPADVLSEYCGQEGVRCAIIADKQGRSLANKNLPPGLDDLVAALANEISSIASDCLQQSGAGQVVNWTITAENGQVLSFNENQALSMVAIADNSIKVAMLELRARQALLDVEGGTT